MFFFSKKKPIDIQIKNVKLIHDKQNGTFMGYGFLEFESKEEVCNALETLNMKPMPKTDNKIFKLNWAEHNRNKYKDTEYSVYVADLDPSVTDQDLFDFFKDKFPGLLSSKIIIDPSTKKSKGYGFVKFREKEDMDKAMLEMNNKKLKGRPVRTGLGAYKRVQRTNKNFEFAHGFNEEKSNSADIDSKPKVPSNLEQNQSGSQNNLPQMPQNFGTQYDFNGNYYQYPNYYTYLNYQNYFNMLNQQANIRKSLLESNFNLNQQMNQVSRNNKINSPERIGMIEAVSTKSKSAEKEKTQKTQSNIATSNEFSGNVSHENSFNSNSIEYSSQNSKNENLLEKNKNSSGNQNKGKDEVVLLRSLKNYKYRKLHQKDFAFLNDLNDINYDEPKDRESKLFNEWCYKKNDDMENVKCHYNSNTYNDQLKESSYARFLNFDRKFSSEFENEKENSNESYEIDNDNEHLNDNFFKSINNLLDGNKDDLVDSEEQ